MIAAVVDRQSARLIYSEKIHNEFLRLAVNGNSVEDVLSALRSLLGRSAVFVDMRFRRIHYSDGAGCICVRLAGMGFDELTPEILSRYLRHAVANSVESFGLHHARQRGRAGPRQRHDNGGARIRRRPCSRLRMMDRVASQRIEDKYRDVFPRRPADQQRQDGDRNTQPRAPLRMGLPQRRPRRHSRHKQHKEILRNGLRPRKRLQAPGGVARHLRRVDKPDARGLPRREVLQAERPRRVHSLAGEIRAEQNICAARRRLRRDTQQDSGEDDLHRHDGRRRILPEHPRHPQKLQAGAEPR